MRDALLCSIAACQNAVPTSLDVFAVCWCLQMHQTAAEVHDASVSRTGRYLPFDAVLCGRARLTQCSRPQHGRRTSWQIIFHCLVAVVTRWVSLRNAPLPSKLNFFYLITSHTRCSGIDRPGWRKSSSMPASPPALDLHRLNVSNAPKDRNLNQDMWRQVQMIFQTIHVSGGWLCHHSVPKFNFQANYIFPGLQKTCLGLPRKSLFSLCPALRERSCLCFNKIFQSSSVGFVSLKSKGERQEIISFT